MKLLLADDEKELTNALGMILKLSGYEVSTVNNGEDAFNNAMKENYDALILDVMMPGMEGTEVTRKLRENNIETPILLLTAKSEINDKINGLDKGANDYLTKPFNKDELLARIRAITRPNQSKFKKIKVGNITLDREKNEISSDKATFILNNKEGKLLETLVNNKGKVLKKEELIENVWKNVSDEKVVPLYISYLQKKFEALGANIYIDDKNGYCLKQNL